jgi:hypothetical protein
METLFAIVAGGFLLGLAGSVHCACMCGSIASGALFLLQPADRRERLRTLLLLQGGRIATYAAAGGAVAGTASLAIDPDLTATSFRALQWLSAVVLMWVGLSTAGMLPRLAMPVAGSVSLALAIEGFLAPLRRLHRLGPFALGLSWGLTPCPMVYAALLSAALTGSSGAGALWMLAFGAGTLPGVVSAAFGVSWLSRMRRSSMAGPIAGLAIAAFGFSAAYLGWPLPGALCATR